MQSRQDHDPWVIDSRNRKGQQWKKWSYGKDPSMGDNITQDMKAPVHTPLSWNKNKKKKRVWKKIKDLTHHGVVQHRVKHHFRWKKDDHWKIWGDAPNDPVRCVVLLKKI